MKKLLLFVLLVCCATFVFSQEEAEDQSYTMFETVYLIPKMGEQQAFEAAVKAHNEKYHAEDPYTAYLHIVETGPASGSYLWAMGPTMFSHLDDRPSDDGHDDDWSNNVVPLLYKSKLAEYWILKEDLSYTPEVYEPTKFFVQVMDIARREDYRFEAVLKKVVKVYEENNFEYALRTYSNAFHAGDGRDMAFVIGFDSWSWFDRESPLKAAYKEM